MSVVVLEYVSRLYVLLALESNVESLGTEPLTLQHRQPELPCHRLHLTSGSWPVKRHPSHYSSVQTKSIVPDIQQLSRLYSMSHHLV
jgi:hypothetical protein